MNYDITIFWCPICQCYENMGNRKWELNLFLDIANWMDGKGVYK